MAQTKKGKKGEREYSYEEFLKTFYPKPTGENKPKPSDPKDFGVKLAEAALKRMKSEPLGKS